MEKNLNAKNMYKFHDCYQYFHVWFLVPFYQINKMQTELDLIGSLLGLKVDLELLTEYYETVSEDSIVVFGIKEKEDIFVFFDTKNTDHTDQCMMIKFGLRAYLPSFENIMEIIFQIYHSDMPRGNINLGFRGTNTFEIDSSNDDTDNCSFFSFTRKKKKSRIKKFFLV